MRKLVINTFLSLDGVMQAPGAPEEDPTGGFAYGGWSMGYWDEQMGKDMGEFMGKPFDLLLGRKTYEIFAAYWPYSKEPGAAELNKAHKHVASKILSQVNWENSSLIKGDVIAEVRKLKNQDGPEIQVYGSSNLIQTLLKNDLIDEYQLWLFPVTLGTGKRLFEGGTMPVGFKMTDSKVSTTSLILAKYVRDGEIKMGAASAEAPSAAELARRKKLREEN